MTNVLVTGATGLIGGPATRRLVSLGHKVVAFDAAPNIDNLGDVADDVEVVRGDVADLPSLLRLAKRARIERVLHFAATIKDQSIADPLRSVMTNTAATTYLFEIALALDIERVCWASTAGVYGHRSRYPAGTLVSEDDLVGPSNPYGATKLACEQISLVYQANRGLDVVAFRLPFVYGLGRLTGATGQYNEMLRAIAAGMPAIFPPMSGGRNASWQPLYNEDMAAVFVEATLGPPTEHAIYNAPVDETLTVQGTLDLLHELAPGAQVQLADDAAGNGTIPLLDGSRARRDFSVDLEHRLRDGWSEMLDFYAAAATRDA